MPIPPGGGPGIGGLPSPGDPRFVVPIIGAVIGTPTPAVTAPPVTFGSTTRNVVLSINPVNKSIVDVSDTPAGSPISGGIDGTTVTTLVGMLYGKNGLLCSDANITTDGLGNLLLKRVTCITGLIVDGPITSGDITASGDIGASSLTATTVVASENLIATGQFSTDSGNIITDGNGNLLVSGGLVVNKTTFIKQLTIGTPYSGWTSGQKFDGALYVGGSGGDPQSCTYLDGGLISTNGSGFLSCAGLITPSITTPSSTLGFGACTLTAITGGGFTIAAATNYNAIQVTQGNVSFDNANIYTDGFGHLYVSGVSSSGIGWALSVLGKTRLDTANIVTDGSGHMTFSATSGAAITTVTGSTLSFDGGKIVTDGTGHMTFSATSGAVITTPSNTTLSLDGAKIVTDGGGRMTFSVSSGVAISVGNGGTVELDGGNILTDGTGNFFVKKALSSDFNNVGGNSYKIFSDGNGTLTMNHLSIANNGSITFASPGTIAYAPATPGNWTSTAPTDVFAALNRLAAAAVAAGHTP